MQIILNGIIFYKYKIQTLFTKIKKYENFNVDGY